MNKDTYYSSIDDVPLEEILRSYNNPGREQYLLPIKNGWKHSGWDQTLRAPYTYWESEKRVYIFIRNEVGLLIGVGFGSDLNSALTNVNWAEGWRPESWTEASGEKVEPREK